MALPMADAPRRGVHPYDRAALQAVNDNKEFTGAHLNLRELDKPPYALRSNLDALRPCAGTEYHLLNCGLLVATPRRYEPCGQTCFWKVSAGEKDPAPFSCFDCSTDLQRRYEMSFPIMKELGATDVPRFSWAETMLQEEKQYPDTQEYQEVRSQCVSHELALSSLVRPCFRIVDFNDLCSEVRERRADGSLTKEEYKKPEPYGYLNWDLLPNQRSLMDFAIDMMRVGKLPKPSLDNIQPVTPVLVEKQNASAITSMPNFHPGPHSHTGTTVANSAAATTEQTIQPAARSQTNNTSPAATPSHGSISQLTTQLTTQPSSISQPTTQPSLPKQLRTSTLLRMLLFGPQCMSAADIAAGQEPGAPAAPPATAPSPKNKRARDAGGADGEGTPRMKRKGGEEGEGTPRRKRKGGERESDGEDGPRKKRKGGERESDGEGEARKKRMGGKDQDRVES